ncbi:hypothetical protein [Candidatus Clostridium helianthi]|uniref:Matrix protein C-terminal Paramyxoviridae domain-containing protein n=1 Tax=Candidatus Clostridium helianthi TaxID=3381660 RepID=A0ABW8S315_9CLOT
MEKEHKYITFNQLGVVLCNAKTKRKLISPIYDKASFYTIEFLYHVGYVLRDADNPKKYYSVEEIKEKLKSLVLL